jgi:hypothetical protein
LKPTVAVQASLAGPSSIQAAPGRRCRDRTVRSDLAVPYGPLMACVRCRTHPTHSLAGRLAIGAATAVGAAGVRLAC